MPGQKNQLRRKIKKNSDIIPVLLISLAAGNDMILARRHVISGFIKMKNCTKCNELKNNEEFYFDLRRKVFESVCKKCRAQWQKKFRSENKELLNKNVRQYKQQKRLECLEFYSKGTPQCLCCGEKNIEFLTFDHKNNDGNKHRKIIKNGSEIYRWIIRNNFPPIFDILCFNCNCSKGIYGICPHKKLSTG